MKEFILDICHSPLISINGKALEECNYYTYLGVLIDKNLTWKPHIEYICKKISKACGSLAKLRYCVNTSILCEVYHSLIHSYLRYGVLVWGNTSDTTLQPLKRLVNRAVRIMVFAPFGRVDLDPIYDHLNILDLEKVSYLETCKFMYKLKNNLLPTAIGNYFELRSSGPSTHNYALRKRNQVVTQITPRLVSGQHSMQYRGELIWNEIPLTVRCCNTLNSFKKASHPDD